MGHARRRDHGRSAPLDANDVKDAARGRWREIIAAIGGVDAEVFDGRGRPCPKCGGTDRFSVFKDFDETGGCICRHCHAEKNGDGFATIEWLRECTFLEAVQLVADHLGRPASRRAVDRRVVATYDYRDEAGERLYQVVRYDPKDFRQRKPKSGGGWDWSARGVRQIPYRLPELLAASTAETVFIAEGEKDVERSRSEGLVATCNAGGAGKGDWAAWTSFFQDRNVVILPDADDPGRKHGTRIAEALHGAARSVKVVELPAVAEKGDVSDWLNAGGTRDELERLVGRTAPFVSRPTERDVAWGDPEPLTPTLPMFPVACLPGALRAWVTALAEATQTPIDLPAMYALAVLAAAVQGQVEVEGRRGWRETVNLFVAVVLPSGNRKSAVVKDSSRPLLDWEAWGASELADEIRADLSQRSVWKKRHDHLAGRAAKEEDSETREQLCHEMAEIAAKLEAAPLRAPRLFVDDITAEAMGETLHVHGGRMSILSSEAGIFGLMKGRYSEGKSGPNIDVFLKGHAGETIRVDRIGRASNIIDDPVLTIGLTVQPVALTGLVNDGELRGRGLPARFLYAIPRSTLGHRQLDAAPIPQSVREAYVDRIMLLCPPLGPIESKVLRLSASAGERFQAFRAWMEPQLAPSGDLGCIADWASKLPGAVLRIAGLLHVFEHAFDARPISDATMEAAVAIGRFLIPHANAAFRMMGSRDDTSAAEALLGKIIEMGPTFTRRDLFARVRGQSRFRESDDLLVPLALLEALNWIRRVEDTRSGPGRRSEWYEAHPMAAETFQALVLGRHPQNSRNGFGDASETDFVNIVDIDSGLRIENKTPEADSVDIVNAPPPCDDEMDASGDGEEWLAI